MSDDGEKLVTEDMCAGCGEPMDYQPGVAFRASTDGSVWHNGCWWRQARPIPADDAVERVKLVDRIKQIKAERKTYFDVEGDGVDMLLNDIWDYLEALGYSTRGDGEVSCWT